MQPFEQEGSNSAVVLVSVAMDVSVPCMWQPNYHMIRATDFSRLPKSKSLTSD